MTKSNTAKKATAPVVSVDGLVHIGKSTYSRTDAVKHIVDNLTAIDQDHSTIDTMGLVNIKRITSIGTSILALEVSFDTTANYKKWKREASTLPAIFTELSSQDISVYKTIACNAAIANRLVKEQPALGNFKAQKILNEVKKDDKFKAISTRKSPTKKATSKKVAFTAKSKGTPNDAPITANSLASDLLATLKENNIKLASFLTELSTLTK